MATNHSFIYFYETVANADTVHIIHAITCAHLSQKTNEKYLGIASDPTRAIQRARKVFPEKSFVLCPDCCKVAKVDENNL